jgi:hypothetical protein
VVTRAAVTCFSSMKKAARPTAVRVGCGIWGNSVVVSLGSTAGSVLSNVSKPFSVLKTFRKA